MIEINLLPEEQRKKKRKSLELPDISGLFAPLFITVVSILVFIHVFLLFALNVKRLAYVNMGRDWAELKLQKELIEIVRKENIKMKKNAEAIEALMKKKTLWSRKLNQLSDLILPGVWFTRMTVERKAAQGYLNIEGVVSSAYGDELGIIGRFIKHLKDDRSFFKDFSNIELGSTQLRSLNGIDVMEFNIYCYMKE